MYKQFFARRKKIPKKYNNYQNILVKLLYPVWAKRVRFSLMW